MFVLVAFTHKVGFYPGVGVGVGVHTLRRVGVGVRVTWKPLTPQSCSALNRKKVTSTLTLAVNFFVNVSELLPRGIYLVVGIEFDGCE